MNPNKCFDDGETVTLFLHRQGKIYPCLVDSELYESVKNFRWHVLKVRDNFYAAANMRMADRRTTVLMHVFLAPVRSPMKHKNGDTLDNRSANLVKRVAEPEPLSPSSSEIRPEVVS